MTSSVVWVRSVLVVPVLVVGLLPAYVRVLGPQAAAMDPGLAPLQVPLQLATWLGAALVLLAVVLVWIWVGLDVGAGRLSARGVRVLGWSWIAVAVVGVYVAVCTVGMGAVLARRELGMPGVWLAALLTAAVVAAVLVVLGQRYRDAREELAQDRQVDQRVTSRH